MHIDLKTKACYLTVHKEYDKEYDKAPAQAKAKASCTYVLCCAMMGTGAMVLPQREGKDGSGGDGFPPPSSPSGS